MLLLVELVISPLWMRRKLRADVAVHLPGLSAGNEAYYASIRHTYLPWFISPRAAYIRQHYKFSLISSSTWSATNFKQIHHLNFLIYIIRPFSYSCDLYLVYSIIFYSSPVKSFVLLLTISLRLPLLFRLSFFFNLSLKSLNLINFNLYHVSL